jgi:hypothetical protein
MDTRCGRLLVTSKAEVLESVRLLHGTLPRIQKRARILLSADSFVKIFFLTFRIRGSTMRAFLPTHRTKRMRISNDVHVETNPRSRIAPIRSPDRASAPGFLFPARQRRGKNGVRRNLTMTRHFYDMTTMRRGKPRQLQSIALCEADTRALGMEEIV